ncbi:MAG: LptF/LptG family permease [Phycisphaerae bacterium]|nr:LptF/LptG family permease [Phycisphaerae bacterium]
MTGIVLVVVVAFAAAVRYAAEGRLGPKETLRVMLLAIPPMMQYAMPFAAGFAATLSYHRMSQDNELTAAAAGGIGHLRLLAPAIASGLALSVAMTAFVGNVVPVFMRMMEQAVTKDATKMVVNTIGAGQPLDLGNRLVHADSVRTLGPDPEVGAYERLVLTGVAVIELDKHGLVLGESFAARAWVWFFASDKAGEGRSGDTTISVRLENARGTRPGRAFGELGTVTVSQVVPGLFRDDPKHLSTRELRELPSHPERLNVIDVRRRDLAVHIAERHATRNIDAALRNTGRVRLADEAGRNFVIEARGIQWNQEDSRWQLLSGNAPIAVEMIAAGEGQSDRVRFLARSGGLRSDIGRDATTRSLTLALQMEDVTAQARPDEPPGARPRLSYVGLIPSNNPLPDLLAMRCDELLAERERLGADDPFTAAPADDLARRLRLLGREVVSKRHERLALSFSCLVMIAAGALTAMRLGNVLPLTVYLWSFLPALATFITINAGQQLTHKLGLGGLGVLWGGLGILGVYCLGVFAFVRRH